MRPSAAATTIAVVAAIALSGCASPDHRVAQPEGTLLDGQRAATPEEELRQEFVRKEGCFEAGNLGNSSSRCDNLRELVLPPSQLPEPVVVAPPPPPPRDDG